MKKSDIFMEVVKRFISKFNEVKNVKLNEGLNSGFDINETLLISLLSIDEIVNKNGNEKIQKTFIEDNGDKIDYFTDPPSIYKISFILSPYYNSLFESLKVIGEISGLIKNDNKISVDQIDWHGNNGYPILIIPITDINIDKQIEIFKLLKLEYTPSLFYEIIFGVDSDKKEIFKRVKKRKLSVYDNKK